MKKSGYIHIYTGTGKGKSTAALGLALRSVGWGKRVALFQFFKGESSGEYKAASLLKKRLKITSIGGQHPIFYPKRDRARVIRAIKKIIPIEVKHIKRVASSGSYDVVILDEIINALSAGIVSKKDLNSIINAKSKGSELILTGRGAPEWLIKKADYATNMRMVKHPYNKGLKARRGIEY